MNLTLARGLVYYTGAIFEVKAEIVKIGSIGGGGRYNDLTGIFGLKNMPGVGISFGLDRIYLVPEKLNLVLENEQDNLKILFANFGDKVAAASMKVIQRLRQNGIICELYPDAAKMKKQFGYADKGNFSLVVMIGENEINQQTHSLKNLATGKQENLAQDTFLDKILRE